MRFKRRCCNIVCSFVCDPSGSPEDRTQHYAVISRVWATSPRLPFKVGHPGVEPPAADAASSQRCSCSQSRRAPICTSARMSVRTAGFEPRAPTGTDAGWSLLVPGPASGHPARCQTSPRSDVSGSCGSRTRLDALKGRHPQTDRRTSQIGTRQSRSGSGGARILVSWFSARCYTVSATDPNEKSPASW